MASRRLDFIFGTRGARRAKRDVDAMGRSVDRMGKNVDRTNKRVGFLSRGLRLLQTRLGFVILLAGILTVTLGPPLIAVLALATAALVALGGALIPILALVAAVTSRFELMKGVAGTAAFELAQAAGAFQWAWEQATRAGADKVMAALAKALIILTPLLQELEPAFTLIGDAMAYAIGVASTGFAAMGPEFAALFEAAVPFIHQLGEFLPALTHALIFLGIAGMPVLIQLLKWLTDFSYWLGPALQDVDRFAHSDAFTGRLAAAGHVLGDVFSWLGNTVANLATIVYELYQQNKPLLHLLGVTLLAALIGFGKMIDWVSGNMEVMGPILTLLVIQFTALKVIGLVTFLFQRLVQAWIAASIAGGVLSGVLTVLGGPAGLVILLAAAIYLLYTRSETFRNAVHGVWNGLKTAVTSSIEAVKGPIEWLIDKIGWINRNMTLGGWIGKVTGSDRVPDWIPGLGGLAEGGPARRGGAYVVGETGPELFVPDRSGSVIPHGGWGGPNEIVINNRTHLDGRVVAESVHRHALKKKAVG